MHWVSKLTRTDSEAASRLSTGPSCRSARSTRELTKRERFELMPLPGRDQGVRWWRQRVHPGGGERYNMYMPIHDRVGVYAGHSTGLVPPRHRLGVKPDTMRQ